jgi:hypothetical protein
MRTVMGVVVARGAMLGALVALTACSGGAAETPAVSFLSPADGATVPAGDVAVSVVVEHFALEQDTARLVPWLSVWTPSVAYAHSEGEAAGFVRFSLDDVAVGDVYDTQYTLTAVEAGAHTATAELVYADGDALEPPVSASVAFSAE